MKTYTQNDLILEIWKNIPEHPTYQASSIGRVRHTRLKNIKSQSPDPKGYMRVWLHIDKGNNKKVHRLVAQAFINNPENKPQINHINGIKTDNSVQNLEWCTNSENMAHAIKIGLFGDRAHLKGENNCKSKLKESDVRFIRSIHKEKLNKDFLMGKYNICRSTLNRCLNKTCWASV